MRGALKYVSAPLNYQTHISALMHTASRTFTKGSEAANGAIAELTHVLRIAIEYTDIAKDSHVTNYVLVGATLNACYAHTCSNVWRY